MIKTKAFVPLLNINKYCQPAFVRQCSNDTKPDPIRRTLRILWNDIRSIKNFITPLFRQFKSNDVTVNEKMPLKVRELNSIEDNQFQTHCDILVIGGDSIGSSIAYWLKKKAHEGLNVVVLERDTPRLDNKAYLSLPMGGLHQQFYMPENIQMSLYGAEFMMKAKEELGIDVNFDPQGFLTLASEENAQTLKTMALVQNEFGVQNELLTPERLRMKFPWLNIDDVALGCHGTEKHGWFDANKYLLGLRYKAKEYGAHFTKAELINFEFQSLSDVLIEGGEASSEYNSLDKAIVKMPNGDLKTIKFAICVLATGTNSKNISRLAKVGTGSGLLQIPLPIEHRKFFGFTFTSDLKTAPGLGTPCFVDFNGTHFRRNGLTGNYITGFSTSEESVGEIGAQEVFENILQPSLMHRMKMIETPQIIDSWESSYDYNVFDENGIVGPHPYYNNLYIAAGFSALGVQQSPAVGRTISEMIIDGQFRTIDLTRLGFDRLVVNQPTLEYAFM